MMVVIVLFSLAFEGPCVRTQGLYVFTFGNETPTTELIHPCPLSDMAQFGARLSDCESQLTHYWAMHVDRILTRLTFELFCKSERRRTPTIEPPTSHIGSSGYSERGLCHETDAAARLVKNGRVPHLLNVTLNALGGPANSLQQLL